MMFLAATAILAAIFCGWQLFARLRLNRECGSLNLPRSIFFYKDLVVDIANKEILLEGKWYPPKQIYHWNTASGRGLLGSTPRLAVRIFTNDPGLPIYCFSTSVPATHRRLLEALRIIGL